MSLSSRFGKFGGVWREVLHCRDSPDVAMSSISQNKGKRQGAGMQQVLRTCDDFEEKSSGLKDVAVSWNWSSCSGLALVSPRARYLLY